MSTIKKQLCQSKRSWTEFKLRQAVLQSTSIRQVLHKIHLQEAGGNYAQVQKYIKYYKINKDHLKGKGWSKGLRNIGTPRISLKQILVRNSDFQSYKLKKRLYQEGFKKPYCELCGWAKKALDGRIPLELDHINGDHRDNRIGNLRILCPNCHSLQATHRGRNRKK